MPPFKRPPFTWSAAGVVTPPLAAAPARDPRDGAQPPPPPSPATSPANPAVVARLLGGADVLSEAAAAQVLGAPIAQLLRDRRSILYDGSALAQVAASAVSAEALAASRPVSTAKVKPAGDPGDGKVSLLVQRLDPAMIVLKAPAKLPTATGKGDAPGELPAPARSAAEDDPTLAWVMAELARSNVTCAAWSDMSEVARLNTVRNFFYAPQAVSVSAKADGRTAPQRPVLPQHPLLLVQLIDVACGLARPTPATPATPPVGVPPSSTTPATPPPSPAEQRAAAGARWWAQMRAVGVTCDQWLSADPPRDAAGNQSLEGRLRIIRSLVGRGLLGPVAPWTEFDVWRAVDDACARSADPAASTPEAPVVARLRAVLDCEHLGAQDKLAQVNVIQRAFPELGRDPRAVYRLALKRYDLCNPAGGPGWVGTGFPRILDPVRRIGQLLDARLPDVLGGETAGVSWAQWVKQGPYMPATGPDLLDPVQGATGDCYLVAAMAAIAWTRPDALVQLARPSGPDRLRLQLGSVSVEVSERTPCVILDGFAPIFARGSRLDAQWPGVVEKAYAALRNPNGTDRPNLAWIANDSVEALAAVNYTLSVMPLIAGGALFWHMTYFRTDDALFDLLATYCTPDGRARVPMVAATYAANGFVDRTGLCPNHAYSVLGLGFHSDGRKYVVLRNPWGSSWAGLPHPEFRVPIEGRWLGRMALDGGDGGCFALAHGAFSAAFSTFWGTQ